MKTRLVVSLRSIAYLALGAAFSVCSTAAFAQATLPQPIISPVPPVTLGTSGTFKSTDGTQGSFGKIVTFYGETGKSTTFVYTRQSDDKTRTEITHVTDNPDGTQFVTFTSLDYGAAASFISHQTIGVPLHGQSTGKGIYSTPEGVSGTLTSVETNAAGVHVVNTLYTSSTKAITSVLSVESDLAGKVVIKTSTVDPSGAVTSVSETRRPSQLPPGQTNPGPRN